MPSGPVAALASPCPRWAPSSTSLRPLSSRNSCRRCRRRGAARSWCVAASLAEQGRNVLVIDLDPQFNATSGFGHDPYADDRPTIADVLFDAKICLKEAIIATNVAAVDLVPSTLDLARADVQLP